MDHQNQMQCSPFRPTGSSFCVNHPLEARISIKATLFLTAAAIFHWYSSNYPSLQRISLSFHLCSP